MGNRGWWWLVPVLLVMFAAGADGLDANPFWNDEWYMMRDARVDPSPLRIYGHLAVQNPWHVPGYYILQNPWGRLTDWNPFTLRAMALFGGMLAVAWTFRLARDTVSPRAGLYAAAVLATSVFFVHYLHENRMYTTAVMVTAFATWMYLRVVMRRREPGALDWIGLFAAAVLCFYTHYFLLLLLGALGLYHLLFVPKTRRWWGVTGVVALAALLYLPWLPALFHALNRASSRDVEGLLSGPQTLDAMGYLFSNGVVPFFLILVGLALLWLYRERGKAPKSLTVIAFAVAVIVVTLFLMSLRVRVFIEGRYRYLIFVWPLLAVLTASGMVYAGRLLADRPTLRRAIPTALAVLWAGIGLWNIANPVLTADLPGSTLTYPLHTVMRELRPVHRPGDYIVNVVPDDHNWFRFGNNVMFYVELERLAADSRAIGIFEDEATKAREYQSTLEAIGAGREYVWVAYQTDPEPSVLTEFETLLATETIYDFCGVAVERRDWSLRVDEYARSPVCCTPDAAPRPPVIDYGNGLALMGVDARLSPDGTMLDLYVAWNGGNTLPPETYSVGLHLLDEAGQLVAQIDYGLPVDTFLCEPKSMALGELPAGTYALNAIVYNWQTGARLTGTLVETGEQADALPVAKVEIG